MKESIRKALLGKPQRIFLLFLGSRPFPSQDLAKSLLPFFPLQNFKGMIP